MNYTLSILFFLFINCKRGGGSEHAHLFDLSNLANINRAIFLYWSPVAPPLRLFLGVVRKVFVFLHCMYSVCIQIWVLYHISLSWEQRIYSQTPLLFKSQYYHFSAAYKWFSSTILNVLYCLSFNTNTYLLLNVGLDSFFCRGMIEWNADMIRNLQSRKLQ